MTDFNISHFKHTFLHQCRVQSRSEQDIRHFWSWSGYLDLLSQRVESLPQQPPAIQRVTIVGQVGFILASDIYCDHDLGPHGASHVGWIPKQDTRDTPLYSTGTLRYETSPYVEHMAKSDCRVSVLCRLVE